MARDLPIDDDDPGEDDHAGDVAYRAATGVAHVARAGAYVTGGALIASNGAPAPANESHNSQLTGASGDPEPDAPSPVVTYPEPGLESGDQQSAEPQYWASSHSGSVAAGQQGDTFAGPAPNSAYAAEPSSAYAAEPNSAYAAQPGSAYAAQPQDATYAGMSSSGTDAGLWQSDPGAAAAADPDVIGSSVRQSVAGTSDAETTAPIHVPAYPGATPFEASGSSGAPFGVAADGRGFELPGHSTQAPPGSSDATHPFAASGFGPSDLGGGGFDASDSHPNEVGANGFGVDNVGVDNVGVDGFGSPAPGQAFDGVGDGGETGAFFHAESTLDAHVGLDGIWVSSEAAAGVAVGDLGQQIDHYSGFLGPGAGPAPLAPMGSDPSVAASVGDSAAGVGDSVPVAVPGGPGVGSLVTGQAASGSATGATAVAQSTAAGPAAPTPAPAAPAPPPPAPTPSISVAQPFTVAAPVAAAPPPVPPPAPAPMIAQPVAATPVQTTAQPDGPSGPVATALADSPGPPPLTAPVVAVPALFGDRPADEPGSATGTTSAGESSITSTHAPHSSSGSATSSTTAGAGHAGTTSGSATVTPSNPTESGRPGMPGAGTSTTVTPSDGSTTSSSGSGASGSTTHPTGTSDSGSATVTTSGESGPPVGGAHSSTSPDSTEQTSPHTSTGSVPTGESSGSVPTDESSGSVPTDESSGSVHESSGPQPSGEPTGAAPTTMPSHASTVPSVSTPVQPDRDDTGTGPAAHPAPHGVNPPTTADASPGAGHPVKPVAYEAGSHDTATWPVGPSPGSSVDTVHPGLDGVTHDVATAHRISLADTVSDSSGLHAADSAALSGSLFPDHLFPDHGHAGLPHPALHLVTDPHIML